MLHDIPRFLIFFIEQLLLIFNQMLSIRADLVGVCNVKLQLYAKGLDWSQGKSTSVNHFSIAYLLNSKVSKGAKIRNRYNQVPHLTQDTNGKVTNSQ